MARAIEVRVLKKYQIWIKYDDGIQGVVDLSHLAGKGVFSLWDQNDQFQNVKIGDYGQISWSEDVELCADSLYLIITQKDWKQLTTSHLSDQNHA